MTVTGGQVVALAQTQDGGRYVFGAKASPSNPDPDRFDCSGLVAWVCRRLGVRPNVPDGAWAWKQVASRVPDSVDATVGGHPARVTSTGDVYLSDGVNILHLTGQCLVGVSVVDTSLGVLSVLSASAGQTRG